MLRYGKLLRRQTSLSERIYMRLKILPHELHHSEVKKIPFSYTNVGYLKTFHTHLPRRNSTVFADSDGIKAKSDLTFKNVFNTKNINDNQVNSNEGDAYMSENKDNNAPELQSNHHAINMKEKYSLTDIERMYKSPKGQLHEIYQKVSQELSKQTIEWEFKETDKAHHKWSCIIKVSWPENLSFTTTAGNKNRAGYSAALKVLHWLENQKKLNHGRPIIYSQSDIIEMVNAPVKLEINSQSLENIKFIIETYENGMKDIMNNTNNTMSLENSHSFKAIYEAQFEADGIIDSVGKSKAFNRTPEKLLERNKILRGRYENKVLLSDPCHLPIRQFKENIINAIEDNQVILIKGETGCGKTTQVPQYIMDNFAKRGEATNCNIIVSQPRRLSAISLAERVAEERREQIGDVVGYQVRLAQELPNTPGGILFCTTGILLRKLQFDPELRGCSHVILDEAHERTINTDMALVLLKRAMKKNKNLKVIVMSATINAELFQKYFNSNVIEVPGKIHSVTANFIDDIDKIKLPSAVSYRGIDFGNSKPLTLQSLNEPPQIDLFRIAELIAWITMKKPPGAILCFLPGWNEITQMKKYLEEYSSLAHRRREVLIIPLHSKISNVEQRKIFIKPPDNVRKIVLATDIAETGITVGDVVYVVDSCTHRQIKWDERRGLSSISNEWASQANIIQRKGRAGRVKPGISYHFITREMFNKLHSFPIPEIKRSSLEKTVLDAKSYSSDEKAVDFLGSLPEPPSPNVIAGAVDELIHLGALDSDENLTPLGKRIALFTIHPKLSKAILYSSIFNCSSSIVTIASAISSENNIFTGVLNNKEAIREIKKQYHPSSDHTSIGWLFQQWNSYNSCSRLEARDFCFKSRLYPERMFTLSKVRRLYAEHLFHARMIDNIDDFDDYNSEINKYTEIDELVRGVLLSGLDQIIHQRNFEIRKGQIKKGTNTFITESGSRATISPESVNFKRIHWPSPYLTYVNSTHSEERRTLLIRETSIISPLTVFLFSQARIAGHLVDSPSKKDINDNEPCQHMLITMMGRRNIKLISDKETTMVLLKFRDIMWDIVKYMVSHQGLCHYENQDLYEKVSAYKDQFLQVLSELLNESALSIDDPNTQSKNSQKSLYK